MLDIGKGFGKYAFLTHEYCGIDNTRRPDPTRTLREQSRVAIDAVGVAILKHLGSNEKIMKPKIFEQEQIARAAELGLGAASPEQIQLLAADDKTRGHRNILEEILRQG